MMRYQYLLGGYCYSNCEPDFFLKLRMPPIMSAPAAQARKGGYCMRKQLKEVTPWALGYEKDSANR